MSVDLTALLEEWQRDPVKFVVDWFGEKPDPKQAEVLRALATHDQVAVRSGHGVGKTWTAARAAIWFFVTHPYAKVITTAPTWPQVRKILWPEIHSALRKVPAVLRANFEILDVEVYMRGPKGERLHDWFIVGRASNKPENIQGFHARNLLLVIDEASGVPDELYEALQGARTSANAKVLAIGNPTRPEGFFYDAFHKARDLWATFHIPSTESPHVSRAWIEERKKEWGEDSLPYRVRVLGEFPETASNALIPLHWIEKAISLQHADIANFNYDDEGVEVQIGVDVARMGEDETVFTVLARKGNVAKVVEIESFTKSETTRTARRAKRLYERYNARQVNVDDTGVGGGVTDLLKEEGVRVAPVKFGASPTNPEAKRLFANLKAQIYFELRDHFDPARDLILIIPDHPKLIRDLSAIKVGYTSRDLIKIIDPPKSPDYGDSLALAVTKVVGKGTRLPPRVFLKRRELI